MNKLITLLALCFSFTTYAQLFENKTENELIEDHIKTIEGLTLTEIKEQYNTNVKMLEGAMSFFTEDDSGELKSIAKDDEDYDAPYSVDTTGVYKALNQFKKIEIAQHFTPKYTGVEFAFAPKKFGGTVSLGKGVNENYTPKKIYYKNGTVKSEGIEDYKVNFHFAKNWKTPSPIDSILIDYSINYPNKYDSIILSKENPKITYKGQTVELLKMEHNYAYLRINSAIPYFIMYQGQNKEGKTLNRYMSSTAKNPLEDNNDLMQRMLGHVKKTQKKLNADEFATIAALKTYLQKTLVDLKIFKSTGFNYCDGFYRGNLDQVTLYFATENSNRTISFTAINNNLNRPVIQLMDKKDLLFINHKNKTLFIIKNKGRFLEELSSHYYKDRKHFYYLNLRKKRLDTLHVSNVVGFKNGLTSIKLNKKSKYLSLYSNKNKPVSSSKYIWLKEYKSFLIGKKENRIYSINASGKETLLKDVAHVKNGKENMLIIENNEGLMGLMNTKGKVIAPMQYLSIQSFREGLAHAKNTNNLIGFIDTNGKTVLPFKYTTAYEFTKGVTAVDDGEGFKLINKKGTIIINTNSGGIGISTNNGERVYSLNNKKYNSQGKEIIE